MKGSLGWRLRQLLVCGLVCGAVGASALAVPQAASATVTSFCAKTYGGGEFCNQGHFHNIQWIEAVSSADAFCVMRASEGWAGAPAPNEYCASAESGGYVFQSFFGLGGFAQTHNRHSYAVSAAPAFEYS